MIKKKPNKQEFSAMIKIVLLMSALANLYQAETGGLTANELAAILKGEMTFEKEDVKNVLAQKIAAQLNVLRPEDRIAVLNPLLDYFENTPNIHALMEPSKILRDILGRGGEETEVPLHTPAV